MRGVLVVAVLLAGCAGPTPLADELGFAAASRVHAGYGYEPGIAVGEDGTLYVTAHKASPTNEGTRLSSWLWYSLDDGATWREMPSPLQLHDKLFAFEGDLAVHGDRVYFVDTYLGDATLSTWQATPDGPEWVSSKPMMATAGIDDRPWIAAHDGTLYFLSMAGGPTVAPENGAMGRYWLYRSSDDGLTWTLGSGFPDSLWCHLAPDRADPDGVYVACNETDALGGDTRFPQRQAVYHSLDRGQTFARHELGAYQTGHSPGYPTAAVDAAGQAHVAFIDDGATNDGIPGRLFVASNGGAGWAIDELTPFPGSFAMPWTSSGPAGTQLVSFYGSPDIDADDETAWWPYAATRNGATWTIHLLSDEPAGTGPAPPGDFFQNAIGPDGRAHVVWQQSVADASIPDGYANHIMIAST